MTPKRDPLDMLAGYRPTQHQLEQDWPAEQRSATRESIQASTRPHLAKTRFAPVVRQRRRPWPAIAGLVGTAAAALLVVQLTHPAGGPAGQPAASHARPAVKLAALDRLAIAAKSSPSLQQGDFRHLVAHQSDGRTLESWTAYDGTEWRHDSGDLVNGTEYWKFPLAVDNLNGPSARFLATLPTDPAELERYLLSHVCGSSSRDEAIFVGVGDMLRGDFAPAALRVAAIQVLQRTAHITAKSTHDTLGRPALEVDFVDDSIRPGEVQSLFFDPNTSSVLQEQETGTGLSYTGTYTDGTTVSAVPADVVAKATTAEDHADPAPSGPQPACTWDKNK